MMKFSTPKTLLLLSAFSFLTSVMISPGQNTETQPATTVQQDNICQGCGMVNCTMECKPAARHGADVDLESICEFCGMINCTMGCKAVTYDSEYRKMVVMPGIPTWLYYGGIVSLILISFFFAETIGRRGMRKRRRWRFNLLRSTWITSLVRKPYFPFIFQAPMTALFVFIIYAGLYGHQIVNIAPAITWTIWWAGLIFLIVVAGKAWCLVCPWDMIATISSRLRLFGVGDAPLSLGMKWPARLRNVSLAILFFIILTWLELGYNITQSPSKTAYVAIAMVILALVPAFLFEKKSFCRYGCFVGRISGLYANFAPVEVRAKDKSVCDECTSRDCFKGNDKGNACPTSLCLATVEDNTYCIMCGECVKSCPKDNVAFNLRPFGEDLYSYDGPRKDEALLAVILLALTSFHGLTMTPFWENTTAPDGTIIGWISRATGLGHLGSFTIGMTAVIVAPILIYLLFCKLVVLAAGRIDSSNATPVTVTQVFVRFSYSLLPIALFYHLAHNGMHLFMEGQHVISSLSDPLGRGWDLFGTASKVYPPLLSTQTIWITQVVLVIIGHVFGIIVAHRTAQRLFGDRLTSYIVEVPLLVVMILFSVFSLWIMHLDMNMRGTLL
jgi:hypothetical protein